MGWWQDRASLDPGVIQVGDEWCNIIAAVVVCFPLSLILFYIAITSYHFVVPGSQYNDPCLHLVSLVLICCVL